LFVCFLTNDSFDSLSLQTEDGKLFSWGVNAFGQLGINNKEDQTIPVEVEHLKDNRVVSIACGAGYNIALTGAHFISLFFFHLHSSL
jgi:alpha-tubulin suppressor-like RCC1 family protein